MFYSSAYAVTIYIKASYYIYNHRSNITRIVEKPIFPPCFKRDQNHV